ncbi:hypothetical protein GGR26_001748 [Lewinella marina]|uniref:Secretion system C-terminal sorting domain-containing protein n=1 Tax=Neolewinella marina TaxID=438751 RepID=A0A2G0CDK9_9BACT|nr:hypothetical protein [Neolewinella marina]NJB85980.1 hypothetical protein [Neolewinella marina]PHK98052.1 hypothetical protein CGL56_12740 [Neolewinella marina]
MFTLLLSLILSTGAPAIELPNPDAEPLITRSVVYDDRIELTVANLEKERTLIRLLDYETEAVHFAQRIDDHNGYTIHLSLEKLPKGRYVISVQKGDTERQQIVKKTDVGIICSGWK